MPTTRTLHRSFAGGELSPEMFGRIDDAKYQTGAAKLRNFIAKPTGPAENRAGLAFVREVKDSTKRVRLLPFTYSTTQTMTLEMGDLYIRFHTNGSTLLSSGVPYEVVTPYLEADLFDLHYVQSADVLTITHPNYAPRELKRLGSTNWTLTTVPFQPALAAPTSPGIAASPGYTVKIKTWDAGTGLVVTVSEHNLVEGDKIYVKGASGKGISDSFYCASKVPTKGEAGTNSADWDKALTDNYRLYITNYSGEAVKPSTDITASSYGAVIQNGVRQYDIDNYYKVTAVSANGLDESSPSSEVHVVNNLFITGSFNTISWTAVTGAARYNVYKRQYGIYGYIGQSESTSFVDDNIAPDLGLSPPIYDAVFDGAGKYPAAVSYFEQRRCFAGTINEPQKMWMTRSSTESDMSYSIPVKDTDRIALRIAAREANTIRHIVPLSQLLLLTSSAEWRVTSVNSDALTPSSISVRPQSYIGASNVQPQIINNSLVYCAARGGHVRELGYSWQSNGFVTGDMSLRSAHLFDNLEIVDMAYSKAPEPIIWFVSSNGKLLGLTYVPDQQIGSWHQHDTDGVFESCAVVAEGAEDILYAVVKRTINGSQKRYVERLVSRSFAAIKDAFFVDSGLTYNGANTTAVTMTISGGSTWNKGEVLTLTASSAQFVYPATSDVGDAIVVTDTDGTIYRLSIVSTSSTTVAQVQADKAIPAGLRNSARTAWSFARNSISGLTHLEDKEVSILIDGAVHPRRTVSSGTIALERAGSLVHVGLPYVSDLVTLPMASQIDAAFGQGRFKNVNKAWVRVFQSSGIFMGPSEDKLVEAKQRTTEPYGSPPALKSEEIPIMLTPSWADSGQIFMRQRDPLPLTVVNLTLEVALGG
jgi:hypothetical protein